MPHSPFSIDGAHWQPVSGKLIHVRTWVALISLGLPTAAAGALAVLTTPWVWIAAGVTAAVLVWALWLIRRQVPAIEYCELSDELAVRRGIMFKTLTIVPYGRMQYIEVDSGPLARQYGIATVTLHTASASSDAQIPGLPEAEATRLRDRLSKRSESALAGL